MARDWTDVVDDIHQVENEYNDLRRQTNQARRRLDILIDERNAMIKEERKAFLETRT